METKIGTSSTGSLVRSYVNSVKSISARRNASAASAPVQRAYSDTFTKSSASSDEDVYLKGLDMSGEMRDQLKYFHESTKNIQRLEPLNLGLAPDDHAGRTKFNFDIIKKCENNLNESISQGLEKAGVPKDVTFGFDYDYNSMRMEITEISDEKYRESVENVLAGSRGKLTVISCASRVMNGYISSIYYPWISKSLESCFGQDINDLYIDENGDLCGVNKNLQTAINAEMKANKKGENFDALEKFNFPANNIEDVVKRLVSDKNITPNISHMGYDGELIYTNDGEFKFGKEFDPNLFDKEKYVMRGTSAFYMSVYNHIDLWIKNYENFY